MKSSQEDMTEEYTQEYESESKTVSPKKLTQ